MREDAAMQGGEHRLETLENAFATPFRVRPGAVEGCLRAADGAPVGLSQRFGGWRGDRFATADPDQAQPEPGAPRLQGRTLYLGHYMRHYGHFITETLSAFWIFDRASADTFDHFVFHPFVFGAELTGYARRFLEIFGVPAEKVTVLGAQGARFDEVAVPERLLRLNHSADPGLAAVHRRIAEAARAATDGAGPRKLYLSRRRLNLQARRRIIANEQAAEQEFRRRGFSVIYPERMAIDAQLGLYARAEALAGPSGSGLHNSLFLPAGAASVEIGDPRYRGEPAPTQVLCDQVSGARAVFVPFEGRVAGPDRIMTLDVAALARRLDATGLPALARDPAAPTGRFGADRLAGLGEQAFILGRALARRLAGRSAA